MRKFGVLVVKELRELITVQMLLPLVAVVLVFAAIGDIVSEQGEKSAQETREVAVFDVDGSEASALVREAIESAGFEILNEEPVPAEDIPDLMREQGLELAVLIPEGFGQGLGGSEPQRIGTFAALKGFSIAAATDSETISAVLRAVNRSVSASLISAAAPGADPLVLTDPVVSVERVIIGDRDAEARVSDVMGFIMQQTTFIPIVLFIVIIFASQMIATTIASEKENKTLETMLSMPVSRTSLIGAKMVAASIVALLSALVYMYGMRSYMNGLTSGFGEGETMLAGGGGDALQQLGLQLGGMDYALLAATLFSAILVALAVAVILGAFAENVKAVQPLLAPLMVLVLIPYFLSMFVDLEKTSAVVKWFVLAIPFSHPFLAAPNLFLGNYGMVLAGIAYELAWFVVLVIVAGRIFRSDRILTMKLSIGKKRGFGFRSS